MALDSQYTSHARETLKRESSNPVFCPCKGDQIAQISFRGQVGSGFALLGQTAASFAEQLHMLEYISNKIRSYAYSVSSTSKIVFFLTEIGHKGDVFGFFRTQIGKIFVPH
jgi:hypothetical protein